MNVAQRLLLTSILLLTMPLMYSGVAISDEASIKWKSGDKSGAIAAWQKVIATSQEAKTLDAARSALANALSTTGDATGSMAVWKEIINTSQNQGLVATAKMRVAYLLTKTKAPIAEQLEAFQRVAREHPQTEQARVCLLRTAYLQLKAQPSMAAAAFANVSELYPDTAQAAEADYRRGLLLERGRKDIDVAIDALGRAANNPEAPGLLREIASVEQGYARIMKYMGSAKRTDLEEAASAIKNTIPALKNREMSARAYLALGECYIILDGQVPNEDMNDKALSEKLRHAQYALDAENAYQQALMHADSAYLKMLARYGIGYSYFFRCNWKAAEKCFSEILADIPGKNLKEKQAAWIEMGNIKTSTGYAAAWSLSPEWRHLVHMAIYWKGQMLNSLGQKQAELAVYQELVDQLETTAANHWTIKDAKARLARASKEGTK